MVKIRQTSPKKSSPAANKGKVRSRKASKKRKGKGKKQTAISIWIIIAIIAALAIGISIPYLTDESSPYKGAPIPAGSFCYGLDISHYQDRIIWDSLMVLTDRSHKTIRSKTAATDIKPISFVFIKATEGTTMKDKKFRKHWAAAEQEKLRKGAYHFFRSSKNGEVQARHFIRTVGEIHPWDLPPVLDIETIHPGCSHKTLNSRALDWLETIEGHYGRKPIVYSSSSFIENILCQEIKDNYPIWVAHYGTDRPGYQEWEIWQFTDQAIVYGIEGHTDLNVCSPDFLKSL